jgi:predicted Zn-dependent protease
MEFQLDHPNIFYVQAAQGWLDLGNPAEAREELKHIEPAFAAHPAVLETRFQIAAQEKHWNEALEIGRQLKQITPEEPASWIHEAFALHELKRTQEAWDALLPAAGKFPKVSLIPYNLACYACQLGRSDEARKLLRFAMQIGDAKEVRRMAMSDRDLEPLWGELGEDKLKGP